MTVPTADQAGACEVHETHISILLFLGNRVLKLHKPLTFDFVDFSTLAARGEDCRREVELNRRLSPDVYLGVADLTMDGETLDHLVVMRRLPAESSLAHRVRSGPEPAWGADVGAVARVLADFHARAERSASISGEATVGAVTAQFEANVAATTRFVGSVLEPNGHQEVVSTLRRFLAGRLPLFSARIEGGHICDGHGDLQAADIYCLEDGPRILDCLEFDDRLRYGDVVADVAFLVMDLERLGAEAAAERFVRDYEERAGAVLPPSLLHVYVALRAYIRTKVACIRYEQGDRGGAEEAAILLRLARAHLVQAQVRLVLVGGLPGTGKSTLAHSLADALGAVVLRSDVVRREMWSLEPQRSEEFQSGRYAPEVTREVYRQLLERARGPLGLGQSVVLDASWTVADHRSEASDLAMEASVDLVELRCTAPPDVTAERIEQRLTVGTDASEATVDVARAMAGLESPWPSATVIDTARPAEAVLAEALRSIALYLTP